MKVGLLVFILSLLTFRLALSDELQVASMTQIALNSGPVSSIATAINTDGRFVAFSSYLSKFVPNDTNDAWDIFVYDRITHQTTRVSVDSNGVQGNYSSSSPSISGDGRFVAFESYASNLVPNDTNGEMDVFVHDRQTGKTTRASVDSNGVQGNADSQAPNISADGRFVAFESDARNLVADDTGWKWDIFVHDLQTSETTRVSVDSNGVQGNYSSSSPSISGDGRFVAFQSSAGNLVADDTNGKVDVFVYDRQTGQTTRVSVDSNGIQGNDHSIYPSISDDGGFVAFISDARNLVPPATDGAIGEVFVHNLQTGETTQVCIDSIHISVELSGNHPSISGDGRFVVFSSHSSKLVPDDTNDTSDVFAYDRQTGQTIRVSVDSRGNQWPPSHPSFSYSSSMSADGRFVAFESNGLYVANDNYDIFVAELQRRQVVCTYIYSAWGACQSNGTQTRTVVSSSPENCRGTSVTSQPCTYIPPFAVFNVNVAFTRNTAAVAWQTNKSSDSTVHYGLTKVAYTNRHLYNASLVTSHNQRITGLKSNTTYYYKVCSKTAAGENGCSDYKSFKTAR